MQDGPGLVPHNSYESINTSSECELEGTNIGAVRIKLKRLEPAHYQVPAQYHKPAHYQVPVTAMQSDSDSLKMQKPDQKSNQSIPRTWKKEYDELRVDTLGCCRNTTRNPRVDSLLYRSSDISDDPSETKESQTFAIENGSSLNVENLSARNQNNDYHVPVIDEAFFLEYADDEKFSAILSQSASPPVGESNNFNNPGSSVISSSDEIHGEEEEQPHPLPPRLISFRQPMPSTDEIYMDLSVVDEEEIYMDLSEADRVTDDSMCYEHLQPV